jgi:chromosome segregation ATPase
MARHPREDRVPEPPDDRGGGIEPGPARGSNPGRRDRPRRALTNVETAVGALVDRADRTDRRLDGIDRRLDGIDGRFDRLEAREKVIDRRLDLITAALERIEAESKAWDASLEKRTA